MKLPTFTILLFILTSSLFAQAQPANDEPCNATFLGRLDANNRNIVVTGLSNVGATNETILGDDGGLVLDVNGTFPSCKGQDSWRNTVWFYFEYEYPFNKIFSYNMTVNSGSLNTTIFLSQSICPLFGNPQVPLAFAAPTGGCNVPVGESFGFGLGCFDFTDWPASQSGRIYILVSSDSDAQEGTFDLEVSLPEPTFCNGCQDQGESAVDDVFAIDNLSKVDENAGSANGSITVEGVTGGKQPLTYSIDGTNFQNETSFENLSAGTYIVTVQDANNCITTQQITIDQLLPEPPTITPPEIECEGEEQTVLATGQNITWYSDAGLTQQVGTGNQLTLTAGEYTRLFATQTVNGFASAATSVDISFISLPEVTINSVGDECSATLTAILNPSNSSATFQWLLNDAEINGATSNAINSIGAGSYRVRVTVGNCIILSEPFDITGDIPSKPIVEAPPVYCGGDIIQALNAQSNGEIQWYADENLTQEVALGNTFTPSNLTATTTFWVQAALGVCTSEVEEVTIQIAPLPTAEIITSLPCVGNVLTASSDLQDVSVQWLKDTIEMIGETNVEITPQEAGNYQVRVSKDGCSTLSDVVAVLEIPSQPEIISETAFCNDVGSITLEATSNFEIFWYSDANLTQQVNQGNTLTTSNISSQIFYLQAQNGACVSEVTQLILSIKSTPIITLSASSNSCVGEPVLAILSEPNAEIVWLLDGVMIPNENGVQLIPQAAGSYTATATFEECTGTSNEIVIEDFPPKPVIEPVPTYCEGDAIAPITATSSGNLRWYSDVSLTQEVGSGESFQPTNLTATTTFYLQAANNNCLSDTTGITVTINPIPTASINASTLCIGEPLEAITDNPNSVSYQWLLNSQPIVGATQSIFVTQEAGSYQVVVSSGSCRTVSEPVQVNEPPIANAGIDQVVCLGDPITLLTKRTSQTHQYEWLDTNGNSLSTQTEFEVTPSATTFFVLNVTDENGCNASDTIDVFVDTTPIEAGFSIPFIIGYAPLEITFTDQSIAADTVTWDFGDGTTSTERSPTYTFEMVGEYEVVQQVSANGICFRDSTILIRVVEPLNIPNGISPNGDGSNDRWIIENIELFPEHTIKVFNQWGNKVFEATNYQNDWSGDQLPDATYFYVITLGGNIPDAKGYLMILR